MIRHTIPPVGRCRHLSGMKYGRDHISPTCNIVIRRRAHNLGELTGTIDREKHGAPRTYVEKPLDYATVFE